MNRIIKYTACLTFLLLVTRLSAQEIKWEVIAPGVWKGTIGKPESYNLLTAAGLNLLLMGLKMLGRPNFLWQKMRLLVN